MNHPGGRPEHRGRLLAAGVAVAAALPGLTLAFLSDDWAQIAAAGRGELLATPFHYFRPLYMALYWIDLKVWGLHAAGFHLTNVLLIGVAASLVAPVVRRWTDDARLAGRAALLFALHPYHVENAAWVAARNDPLMSVFYMLALLGFERWRIGARRPPWLVMALAEAALLSKESAATIPALLALRCAVLPDAAARRRALRLGVVPLLIQTAAHLLVLRPYALGGPGRTLGGSFGVAWVKDALGMAAASILPLEVERLAYRPIVWGLVAAGGWIALLAAARRAARLPRAVPPALCAFAILAAPHVIGFQERYLFLPAAASSVAIAALLLAAGPALGRSLLIALVGAWILAGAGHWRDWREASRASESLLGRLVEEAAAPGVEEVVIANAPHRVAGASVGGDFGQALELLGARRLKVTVATWVSYPSAESDALAGPPEWSLDPRDPARALGPTVSLRVDEGPFLRYVGPEPGADGSLLQTVAGEIAREGPRRIRVSLPAAPGRALLLWDRGRLISLERPEAHEGS